VKHANVPQEIFALQPASSAQLAFGGQAEIYQAELERLHSNVTVRTGQD